MKSFVQEGNALNCIAPEGGVVSGKAYLLASTMFVVASTTAAEDEEFSGWTEGVYELDAVAHANAQAIDQFGAVYFDSATGLCTKTAAGNRFVGVATEAKISTADSVVVKLHPLVPLIGAAIADIALAAVAGVDGAGNNAASKADVDARFVTVTNKINAIIAALEASGVTAA